MPPPPPSRTEAARSWPRALLALLAPLLLGWAAVLLLVAGSGLALGAAGPDAPLLESEDDLERAVVDLRTPVLDDVTAVVSGSANTGPVVVTAVVGALVLRRLLHRWREPLLVLAATWGQSLVFLGTTLVVQRERPEVQQLDRAPPTSSFPSGHTSAAIALCVALALVVHRRARRRWVRTAVPAALLVLPVLVGLSRLYRGMHHPTDLLGSVLCAGLVLVVVHRVVLRAPLPEDSGTAAADDQVTPEHPLPQRRLT